MRILAHRGLLHEYPENSFPALTNAMISGLGIETDLRWTRDKDFLLIHDESYLRLTGRDLLVSETTIQEAREIFYSNTNTPLISFRTLLQWVHSNDRREPMAIQVKADSQTDEALHCLAAYWKEFNLYEQAFVFDLTLNAAQYLKTIDARISIAFIISDYLFEPTIYSWEQVRSSSCMDIVWAAEYRHLYTKEFIKKVKETHRPFYAVSPDIHKALGHPKAHQGYEEVWEHLKAWGVDGICTDETQECLKLGHSL